MQTYLNMAASTAYDALDEVRNQLLSSSVSSGHSIMMSTKEVIKAGAKVFKNIQSQDSYCMWCNYTKFLMLSLCVRAC